MAFIVLWIDRMRLLKLINQCLSEIARISQFEINLFFLRVDISVTTSDYSLETLVFFFIHPYQFRLWIYHNHFGFFARFFCQIDFSIHRYFFVLTKTNPLYLFKPIISHNKAHTCLEIWLGSLHFQYTLQIGNGSFNHRWIQKSENI